MLPSKATSSSHRLKGSEPAPKLLQVLEDLRSSFRESADPRQAPAMEAYMKHLFPFLGLKKPERAACTKSILSDAKRWTIDDVHAATVWLWNQPEREFQYAAMNLLEAGKKSWTTDSYALMLAMICEKSWWDTVDYVASNLVGSWLLRQPAGVRAAEAHLLNASNFMWNSRTALIFQLSYKQQTDRSLLGALILSHAASKEFFLQKAIGWALRQYARTDAGWVREFVAGHALPKLSKREALKHLG